MVVPSPPGCANAHTSPYSQVVLALAFGDGRPYVKRLWLSLSEPPRTHLSLEALHGMDLANLPVLRKHLKHVVMRCVLPITEPKCVPGQICISWGRGGGVGENTFKLHQYTARTVCMVHELLVRAPL